jgi:hypothetical protein
VEKRSKSVTAFVVTLVAGLVVSGCGGGGASDAEFVAACMMEGQGLASQMLDKEAGITRDQFCTCGAGVARSALSADGYQAMILEMQGRGQEARAITSKMSDAEQMAAIQVAASLLEKCAGVKPE